MMPGSFGHIPPPTVYLRQYLQGEEPMYQRLVHREARSQLCCSGDNDHEEHNCYTGRETGVEAQRAATRRRHDEPETKSLLVSCQILL